MYKLYFKCPSLMGIILLLIIIATRFMGQVSRPPQTCTDRWTPRPLGDVPLRLVAERGPIIRIIRKFIIHSPQDEDGWTLSMSLRGLFFRVESWMRVEGDIKTTSWELSLTCTKMPGYSRASSKWRVKCVRSFPNDLRTILYLISIYHRFPFNCLFSF